MIMTTRTTLGKVILVGCGPGAADLLTIRALKAIEQSNVVIADRLIPKEILDLVPKQTQIIIAGSGKAHDRNKTADDSQDEMNEAMVKFAKEGNIVTRLKGGDPFVFGRGGEEILYLKKFNIDVEVIPGISNCTAAPAAGFIPLTHRGIADQFLVCTGLGRNKSKPSEIPSFSSSRTLVFLMSVSQVESILADLMQMGYPQSLPCAIIEKGYYEEQRVIRGNLSNMSEIVKSNNIQSPSTLIIGDTVNVLSSVPQILPQTNNNNNCQ